MHNQLAGMTMSNNKQNGNQEKTSGGFGGLLQSKKERVEELKYPRLRRIINSTIALSNHALQLGKLPQESKLADIYGYQRKIEANEALSQEEIYKILSYYESLRRVMPAVTPDTLLYTETFEDRGNPIRQYRRQLFILTFLLIILILLFNIAKFVFDIVAGEPGDELSQTILTLSNVVDVTIQFLIPFTYGTLGACAYLLRVTEKHLRNRDFDIVRIPEHWNRVVLGTLSGGIIVLFVNKIPGADGQSVELGAATVGLLAGYSTDFLFDTMDRIIKAILPKVGVESMQKKVDVQSRELRIKRMQELKNNATSDEATQLLESLIEYEQMNV